MANKEQQIARMKELGELLRNASKAYYAEDRESLSTTIQVPVKSIS